MTLELLDLLESHKAEEASVNRLFNANDGRGVRGLRRSDPRYERSFMEASELFESVISGRRPMYILQEAMSTSDFPLLFGDVIDRAMLGRYNDWPSAWAAVARRNTVRDFRTVKRFVTDGGEAILTTVDQGAAYPEASITEGSYTYSVKKYGRRIPFLWEDFINDDLEALRDMPERLARAARMSEERFVTALYAVSTGPNATFFHATNNLNLLAAGAGSALSTASLQTAFGLLWAQKDKDGNPIYTSNVSLVVPPQLAVTARNILNATGIGGGTIGGEDGDFDTDAISYKVRHVLGGTLLEPKAAVASFGQ